MKIDIKVTQKICKWIKLDQKYNLVSTSVFWIVNSLSCTGRSFVLGLTHVLTGKKWLGNLKIWGRSATTNFLPFTDHLFFEWWTTVNLFKKIQQHMVVKFFRLWQEPSFPYPQYSWQDRTIVKVFSFFIHNWA